jgi:YesN/AraC family two-component response regulator
LIIDDEPLNLIMLRYILNKTFKNIILIEARNGKEGIMKFIDHNFENNNNLEK